MSDKKTSHRRKSQVHWGNMSPRICTGGTTMMFVPPEFSTYNVLNNAVCRLFKLICTGYNVLHCI